jgi:hypothetical protein
MHLSEKDIIRYWYNTSLMKKLIVLNMTTQSQIYPTTKQEKIKTSSNISKSISKNISKNISRRKAENDDFTRYKYDEIIDALIKGQKLRHQYQTEKSKTKTDLCIRFDPMILGEDSIVRKTLLSVYDKIIEKEEHKFDEEALNKFRKKHNYVSAELIDSNTIGKNDTEFDTDYEYDQIKKKLGPIIRNHFMFKERDLEIVQRGGFDFNEKKIVFEKEFDPQLDQVCELYEINCDRIKHSNLKYYHTDPERRYRPYNVQQMLNGIEEYDYVTPLKKLANYHSKNSYYSKLLDKTKEELENATKNKMRLNLVDKISPEDRDSVMTQYVKCRPNTFIITLWEPAIPALDDLVQMLEKDGNVYYIKTMHMSKISLINLMFLYYDDYPYTVTIDFIDNKLEYTDTLDDNIPVCAIVFDNVKNKSLTGQDSQYKKELRSYVIKQLDELGFSKNNNYDHRGKYRENDVMHINDYFYQTVEYSQMLFNENSLAFLENSDLTGYMYPYPHPLLNKNAHQLAGLKFQTFRNIVYSEMSLIESDRLMLLNDDITFDNNAVSSNIIDMIIIDIEPNYSPKLSEIIKKLFLISDINIIANTNTESEDHGTGFDFLRVHAFNFDDETNAPNISEFVKKNSTKDVKDLVLNPSNFFYFQGIKFIKLNDKSSETINKS